MRKGPPPPEFFAPIPADVIARVIVLASRETGADPIAVASGELDQSRGQPFRGYAISRARYYAGAALKEMFPTRSQTMLAQYVGASWNSAGSFYSALNQRINAPAGLPWWRPGVVGRIVQAVGGATVEEFFARERRQVAKPEPEPAHGPLRTSLDRFTDGGLPAGGQEQLAGRARETRACRDMLAEAAANTAKLQAKLPPEPDGD